MSELLALMTVVMFNKTYSLTITLRRDILVILSLDWYKAAVIEHPISGRTDYSQTSSLNINPRQVALKI